MKKEQTGSHAEARSSRRESSWQTKPVEEVCNVEYGTRVVQKRDGGKGFPVYGGGGATFEMDGFNREDRLIVARFGMSEECTRFVVGKFFLNDSGLTVSPKNGAMHQRFLDYQMLALNDDIYALGKGTAQKNLDVPVFRTLPLFVPESLAEQQRIVGLLDEAFEGLATATTNAEKNLQNARALFESHLQSVFTQRGAGWVATTLEKVLATQPQNGWSPPAENHSASGIPVLTLSSVTGFRFRPDKRKFTSAATDSKKKYWVKNGDFLITRSNTPELVGHVAIATGIEEPTIYPDLIMRMNPMPDRALTEFLYYHLRTPALRTEIMGRAQGANPTMKKISNGAVKTLPITVPPIATQQAIVETLNDLTEETQRLARLYERKLSALEALKKSLLHQAFTGEL